MKTKNSIYLSFSVLLVILSVIGGIFLFRILKQQNNSTIETNTPSKIELIPTDSPDLDFETIDQDFLESSPTATLTASPTTTPTLIPTTTPTIVTTPTLIPTDAPSEETTSTNPLILLFNTPDDKFSVEYSSIRKFYKDTTINANRYTFYLNSGNFAIHVNSEDSWAWVNSNRQFSDTFIISGQPTFRYDIDTQTIVDIQLNDKNYTIQCVHNGNETLKAECETFIQSFKLL